VDQARALAPGELQRMLREQAGLDLAALVPADGGESASTFLATGQDGTVSVLKISPSATSDSLARLRELVAGLRRRGYPAARLLASGQVAGVTFWLQERLRGAVLGHPPGWLVPEVLRLNDAQAGLGDGTCRLSELITATLTTGGDGYCVHATLEARPDTRDLLAVVRQTADRCLPAVPGRSDFVHYDFTLANLLTSGAGISGVIDINPPALTGDRAFDLATLLFYLYDRDGIRERLRGRALELTDRRALNVYLAHMVLRQVDWSLRHHPGTRATAHHLRLARLVAADLAERA
jgi:aminoglycoside phosphotransferase (APT) family kinase protein